MLIRCTTSQSEKRKISCWLLKRSFCDTKNIAVCIYDSLKLAAAVCLVKVDLRVGIQLCKEVHGCYSNALEGGILRGYAQCRGTNLQRLMSDAFSDTPRIDRVSN